MTEKYDLIFNAYKEYMEKNSQYGVRVVKYNNNTSTYFPIITLTQQDNRDYNQKTCKDIDYFEEYYFTIDIYTKNKVVDGNTIAAQVIDKELETLTSKFFKNLNKTGNRPTPNLDTSVFRRTMQYSCTMGNRGNIIRR